MEIERPSSGNENTSAPDLLSGGDSSARQWEVLSYFAILNVAMGLGSPQGIASIPISYFLKDSLHLSPVLFAVFIAIVSTPVCLGFMFGFIRDRWRSARWGDRQYLLAGAIVAAGIYLWLAASTIDY